MLINKPLNQTQERFNALCKLGGGKGGGPARTKVQALLSQSGKQLNQLAYKEIAEHLTEFSDRNPWHICFAVALSSLRGAYTLFQRVKLPDKLPTTLKQCGDAQQRWIGQVIGPHRPPYIGSWNATAMFMVAFGGCQFSTTRTSWRINPPVASWTIRLSSRAHSTRTMPCSKKFTKATPVGT